MTPADLARLVDLDAMATKNWRTQDSGSGGRILRRGPDEDAPRTERHPQSHLQIVPTEDAEFIAALRNAAPALLRAARTLTEARDRIGVWREAAQGRQAMSERDSDSTNARIEEALVVAFSRVLALLGGARAGAQE